VLQARGSTADRARGSALLIEALRTAEELGMRSIPELTTSTWPRRAGGIRDSECDTFTVVHNRQVNGTMRTRLLAGEADARMYQEPGLTTAQLLTATRAPDAWRWLCSSA
jgi:hypothetical protein